MEHHKRLASRRTLIEFDHRNDHRNAQSCTAQPQLPSASNPAGWTASISLTVQDEAPNIDYGGPYTFTKNTAISTITPNTGGAATSITSGSLPAGLSLNSANGDIIGTPDAVYSTGSVTVEASNAVGADSFSIMIEVVDLAPNITYAGSPFTFTKNTPTTMITPSNTGGEVPCGPSRTENSMVSHLTNTSE